MADDQELSDTFYIEQIGDQCYIRFLEPKDEDGKQKVRATRPAWDAEWAMWKALLAQKRRIEELEHELMLAKDNHEDMRQEVIRLENRIEKLGFSSREN